MRIHLVYPNFKSGNAGGTQEPLGILSIASALRQAGHRVTLTDLTFEKDLSVVDACVKEAEVLGIGCSTPLFGKALDVLRRAQGLNPSLFAVAGGPHATQDPNDALSKGFQAVVLGEAEKSVVDLMASLDGSDRWKALPGVAHWVGGKVVETRPMSFIENLDEIPLPARDLIDQRRYLKRNGYVSLLNTRGCPFQCLYCKPMQDKLFGKKFRTRSPGHVVEEIAQAHRDYGARRVYFKDDTLLLCGQQWFEAFRREMDIRRLKVGWYCLGRVDQVNESLLKTMKSCGAESGSQRILDFYQKGITPAQTREAFSLCHKHGIMTHAYIMLGAPSETVEDLEETLKLFREIRPYSYRAFVATPFPGNHLYEYARERGLSKVQSYEEYDNALNLVRGHLPMKLEHLSLQDIQKCAREIQRACVVGNLHRCLTHWRDLKLALKHVGIALNSLLGRL